MSATLRLNSFRFFYYFNGGNPREPAYIYVRKAGTEVKFWLSTVENLQIYWVLLQNCKRADVSDKATPTHAFGGLE